MARFKIKESEIRSYVRSLIREALEAEDYSPENQKEIDKMERGDVFNYGNLGSGAREDARRYMKNTYGVDVQPKLPGVRSYTLIDPKTGLDADPNHTPEALKAAAEAKKVERRNQSRLSMHDKRHKSEQQVNRDDAFGDDSNLSSAEYFKRFDNASDDEKTELRNNIRQARQGRNSANVAKYQDILRHHGSLNFPSAEELKQQILNLNKKKEALGPHNDLNDGKYKEYDRLIKDRKRILNKYHSGNYSLDSNYEMADAVVNDAFMGDLSDAEEFGQTGELMKKMNKRLSPYDSMSLDDAGLSDEKPEDMRYAAAREMGDDEDDKYYR